jgi:hypothetical protein
MILFRRLVIEPVIAMRIIPYGCVKLPRNLFIRTSISDVDVMLIVRETQTRTSLEEVS